MNAELVSKTTNQLVVGDVIRLGVCAGLLYDHTYKVEVIAIEKNQFNTVRVTTRQLTGDSIGLVVIYPWGKRVRQWVAA